MSCLHWILWEYALTYWSIAQLIHFALRWTEVLKELHQTLGRWCPALCCVLLLSCTPICSVPGRTEKGKKRRRFNWTCFSYCHSRRTVFQLLFPSQLVIKLLYFPHLLRIIMYTKRSCIDSLIEKQSCMKAACFLVPLFILCRMELRSHF